MKKIIIAIVALFISMVANAQISADYWTFTLGDYVFNSFSWDVKAGEGGKYFIILNEEEAITVKRFIINHKDEIGDKLGFVIDNCELNIRERELDVWVYEKNYYEGMVERRRQEKERVEAERQARISSLGELLK